MTTSSTEDIRHLRVAGEQNSTLQCVRGPGLSPQVEQLLTDIAKDGFAVHCCGRLDDPTALVASYEWPGYVDLLTIRDFGLITTARVPKPERGSVDVFEPEIVVWAYQGSAVPALRALLNLVHPQHPDAPIASFTAPRSLRIPRREQRPMTVRLASPERVAFRAARLSAALTSAG